MLTNEAQFTSFCLRKLGEPVIKVNLAPEQIADAIDDAIRKFNLYHRDGYEENFYVYTIPDPPERDIIIPESEEIDEVVEVIPTGSPLSGQRFDTYAWQASAAITSPQTGGWSNIRLTDYVTMSQRLTDLNAILGDEYPIRYNAAQRKITLRFPVHAGETFAFKTYKRNDPRVAGNETSWNDPWLREYATALIKERWGNVLSKVSGVRLVGGVEINGAEILSSAKDEIEKLESQLKLEHQLPILPVIG